MEAARRWWTLLSRFVRKGDSTVCNASADTPESAASEPPSVSVLPGAGDPANFWPASLAHLALPYDDVGSDYVTVAEISELPQAGHVGYRKVSVALVPLTAVQELLESTASTGHEVESHGPLPIVDDDDPPHRNGFWITGIGREDRFEPIVNSWRGGDIDVLLPDNGLLMVFGLVPRNIGASGVSWDDPHGPVYDVVRVSTISDHQLPKEKRQRAFVEIRRDYLLEYCRTKHSAAVAFYYEQRRSNDDAAFDAAMAGSDNKDFHLPGRLLNLQINRYADERGRQFAQVWGRRLVLPRGERRVFLEEDPPLVWPDHPGEMTHARAGREHATAYVSDRVLQEYEGRPEFMLHPRSGGVSYRGQWSVGNCHRYGRNHISVEIRKLYEGCPGRIIEHWHRYAVPRAVAEADRQAAGSRHIGTRAEELVAAHLRLTSVLVRLGERLGLSFEEVDIGGLNAHDVEGRGWWSFDTLLALAKVTPPDITLDDFLNRALDVAILWEGIQQAPLRNMVRNLGIAPKALPAGGSLKLLGTLSQLATIARDTGHRWPDDAEHFVALWNPETRLPVMRRLFALNQLRQKAAHRTGQGFAATLASDLDAFGIVPAAHAAGWGGAVDLLYDALIGDFAGISDLLSSD